MKTVILLKGDCDAKESFHEVCKNIIELEIDFDIKDMGNFYEILDNGEISPNKNEMFYDCISSYFEDEKIKDEDFFVIIENYDRELSKMLQDDFPIFEIKLVDKMGVLSNTAFCLNWKSEDFEKEAVELITKLAF